MKKIKTMLITITAITVMAQSTFAADIPVESYPDNATEESVAITQNLIGGILDEVQNGLGYQPAWCKANNAVFAAVLGHIFPIFAGFRGGKGVATLVGAITGIYPPVVLLCFAVWVVILMMTHYVSLASIVAGCCFPVFTIASPKVNQSVPFIVFSFVTAVLLLYTHRKNIVRLKNGTESKIYIWKPHRKADK